MMTTGIMMERWKTLTILRGLVPKGEVLCSSNMFEETISNEDRGSDRRSEETAQRELCNLYTSPNIILQRQVRWDEHVAHI
jgi:hypothetical protein